MSRLQKITGVSLPSMAPGLHMDMVTVASRAAAYLAAKMPASPSDPDSITPQLDTPPPVSASDLHVYASRVEGAESPLSLMDDLAKGQVSPDKVDAVKQVWPETFAMMRQAVFAHLAMVKATVPYDKRMLLDATLDGGGSLEPSLRQDFMMLMRSLPQQEAQKQQARPGAPAPQISKSLATRSQQIAAT